MLLPYNIKKKTELLQKLTDNKLDNILFEVKYSYFRTTNN